jgi:hypothetical protein
MGFKKIDRKMGFAELAFSDSIEKNRSLETLEQMNKVIDWNRIEKIIMSYYSRGPQRRRQLLSIPKGVLNYSRSPDLNGNVCPDVRK